MELAGSALVLVDPTATSSGRPATHSLDRIAIKNDGVL
jgi:hypothetical protein